MIDDIGRYGCVPDEFHRGDGFYELACPFQIADKIIINKHHLPGSEALDFLDYVRDRTVSK